MEHIYSVFQVSFVFLTVFNILSLSCKTMTQIKLVFISTNILKTVATFIHVSLSTVINTCKSFNIRTGILSFNFHCSC